jgi:predicted Zn-dependent protease with MMP-like domain
VLLRRLGRIPESPVTIECDNCGGSFSLRPSATFEVGPYRDGELDDPELDAPVDFDTHHRVAGLDGEIRLAPVRVGDVAPLYRALAASEQIDAELLDAMGVVATAAPAELDAEALEVLGELFEQAHYPPRLTTPHRCPDCSQTVWIGAPALREFTVLDERVQSARGGEAFPDADAFERLVRDTADEAYERIGVRNVDLVIIEGPADCDDAGEPLLGSYQPPDPDALVPAPAEVRIYYRTFRNAFLAGEIDSVRDEVAETLEHELEHHLGFLAGHDPVDDTEREDIAEEYARRVGRTEARRRAVRAARTSLVGFFSATWLLWLGVLAALVLLFSDC